MKKKILYALLLASFAVPHTIAEGFESSFTSNGMSYPQLYHLSQKDYPLGVAFLKDLQVQEIKPAIGNGVKANLVLVKYKGSGNPNDVENVYYVKESFKDDNVWHKPPEVLTLIYHNTGDGKEYLGILISNEIYKPQDQVPTKIMHQEVKLDDVSAQYLLDLRTNDTKWNNKTEISYSETTKSNVRPPKIIFDRTK